jgi:hypothetical protein
MVDTPLTLAQIIADIADTGSAGRITPAIVRQAFEAEFNTVPAIVSAAGTTQGTATVLTSQLNIVTTVAAGTGVVAPAGYAKTINAGANAMLMYPPSGAQFDAVGTNSPVSVGVGGIIETIIPAATPTQGYAR